MKLLIVETASDQVMLLSIILKKLGYQFEVASRAEDAIDILYANTDIHIIISGWVMPGMNGIALCQHIRKYYQKHYIYFLFLTSKEDQESLISGISNGADDFLVKPVCVNELKARLITATRIIQLEESLDEKNSLLQESLNIMEEDLKSAAKIQQDLLIRPVKYGHVAFDWFFQASQYVSGDMFGYFPLDNDNVFFYQLDVAGHGVKAALFSFMLNNMISSQADLDLSWDNPEGFLFKLNEKFFGQYDHAMYFTILCGTICQSTGVVTLSRAGHPLPVLVGKDEAKIIDVDGGLPLGILRNQTYTNTSIQLLNNEKLFIYSDGILACKNQYNEDVSEDNITDVLSQLSNYSSLNQVLYEMSSFIQSWHKGGGFEDDVTYLVIEWKCSVSRSRKL